MTSPASTPAAPTYTPFVTDLLRLIRAPFSPTGVFEEQREGPTFWTPWLLVSIAFSAVTALLSPFQVQAMKIAAEARGQPMPPGFEKFALVGVATTPIVVLVMALVASVFLWLPLMATASEVRFKGLMCVTIFAWPIAVLQQVLNYVVLSVKGVESVQTIQDMQVSLGLDLLLPADAQLGVFAHTMLAGIGPLQIWMLAIVAFGLMSLEKVSSTKAWIASSISYVVVLVVSSGVAAIFTPKAG